MERIYREVDGELCGLVERQRDGWRALTLFGAEIGRHERRDDAVAQVLADGLASLVERWTLRAGLDGAEEPVCILEAHDSSVTVARGFYAVPGTPVLRITIDELREGVWHLTR